MSVIGSNLKEDPPPNIAKHANAKKSKKKKMMMKLNQILS